MIGLLQKEPIKTGRRDIESKTILNNSQNTLELRIVGFYRIYKPAFICLTIGEITKKIYKYGNFRNC